MLRNKLRLNMKRMFQNFVASMKDLTMVRLTYWGTSKVEADEFM